MLAQIWSIRMEFVETDGKSISAPNGQQLYKTMAYSYEYVMVLHGVGSRISFRGGEGVKLICP